MSVAGKAHREIAEAIVEKINDASLSMAVTASRQYDPPLALADDLTDVDCVVVLGGEVVTAISRHENQHDYNLVICVRKKIHDAPTTNELDALGDLCEQIENLFDAGTNRVLALDTTGTASWQNATSSIPENHLSEYGQFTWLYSATYRHFP